MVVRRREALLLPGLSFSGDVRMALRSLISLGFQRKRLAGTIRWSAQNLNYPTHIRGQDGQAFPLPSKLRTTKTRKNRDGWRNSH
jgi:hypothetical protein